MITRHYALTQLLSQGEGQSFAIYRMPEEADGAPSPFEDLVDEFKGRFGNGVKVDARDLMAVRILVGGGESDAVTCSDIHVGAIEMACLLGWPRPSLASA